MNREVYLDNSATTRPYNDVINYMCDIYRNSYGNPSSMHTKGIEAERLLRRARDTVAKVLGVSSPEIYFTSGGTESNNLAIRGYLDANPRKGRHIITSKIEHPAVLEVFKYFEKSGYKVDFLDVDEKGVVRIDRLEELICEETSLISIILVNNESGTIQPIERIIKAKNMINPKTAIHVDAVQAFGKMKLMPGRWGIDLMSVSSHKIHGPKGVGALYAAKEIKLRPVMLGGGQEATIRSGTENVPGICGFGMAVENTLENLEQNYQKTSELNEYFKGRLEAGFENIRINSPATASPYILSVSFGNVKSEVLLHHLEQKGIFVSTGSACSSRKNIHSHVLTAMSIEKCYIEGAIRFSFSAFNTRDEIDYTLEALKEIVPKIMIRRGGRK